MVAAVYVVPVSLLSFSTVHSILLRIFTNRVV